MSLVLISNPAKYHSKIDPSNAMLCTPQHFSFDARLLLKHLPALLLVVWWHLIVNVPDQRNPHLGRIVAS